MMQHLGTRFALIWQDSWFFRINVIFAIVGLVRAFVF